MDIVKELSRQIDENRVLIQRLRIAMNILARIARSHRHILTEVSTDEELSLLTNGHYKRGEF